MIRFLRLRPRFVRRGFKHRVGRLQPPSLSAAIELLENRCLLSTTSIDAPDLQDSSEDGDLNGVYLQSESSLSKNGPLSKVKTSLAALFNDWNLSSSRGVDFSFAAQDSFLQVIDGFVVIDAVASEDTASLLADLELLGLEAGSSFGSFVSGRLPIDAIDDVSSLATLQFASAALRPWTNVGDVTSQGDISMKSDIARATFGVDGTGITIGVLSDSFDTGPGSYSDEIASGDLPSGINVLEDFPEGPMRAAA
jgi:hypothetical protein